VPTTRNTSSVTPTHRPCPECLGTGRIGYDLCSVCHGSSSVPVTAIKPVTINAASVRVGDTLLDAGFVGTVTNVKLTPGLASPQRVLLDTLDHNGRPNGTHTLHLSSEVEVVRAATTLTPPQAESRGDGTYSLTCACGWRKIVTENFVNEVAGDHTADHARAAAQVKAEVLARIAEANDAIGAARDNLAGTDPAAVPAEIAYWEAQRAAAQAKLDAFTPITLTLNLDQATALNQVLANVDPALYTNWVDVPTLTAEIRSALLEAARKVW